MFYGLASLYHSHAPVSTLSTSGSAFQFWGRFSSSLWLTEQIPIHYNAILRKGVKRLTVLLQRIER